MNFFKRDTVYTLLDATILDREIGNDEIDRLTKLLNEYMEWRGANELKHTIKGENNVQDISAKRS